MDNAVGNEILIGLVSLIFGEKSRTWLRGLILWYCFFICRVSESLRYPQWMENEII